MTVQTLARDAHAAERYAEWNDAAEKWRLVARSTLDVCEGDRASKRARECDRKATRR